MKNLFLFFFVLYFSNLLISQEDVLNPSINLGGSANISFQDNYYPLSITSTNGNLIGVFSNSNDESKTFSFDFSPYVLKHISKNWMIGFSVNYGYYQRKIDDVVQFGQTTPYDFKQTNHRFGGEVFGRYLLNPSNSLQFYLQPGIGYGYHKNVQFSDDEVNQTENVNYFNLSTGLGVLYQINSKFHAIVNIGNLSYVNGSWKIKETGAGNNFSSINSNFSFSSIRFGIEMKL